MQRSVFEVYIVCLTQKRPSVRLSWTARPRPREWVEVPDKLCLQFSLCMSCWLSAVASSSLPPQIVTPSPCSHKSLTRLLCKSFRALQKKTIFKGCQTDQTGRQTGRVCSVSSFLGPRSVINLICNEAFLKFILFVLLKNARVCV